MEELSHVPYGEMGKGCYSSRILGCRDVINRSLETALDSLKVLLNNFNDINETFAIVDYGAADGGTSMKFLYECVKKIKRVCGEEKNIHVIYEDQPCNDFLSLFMALHGLLDTETSPSYFLDFRNVFLSACGVSFYKQALPPQSVHFAVSFTCIHWLQKKPCNVTNGVYFMQSNVNEREAFKKQAADDWELFLLNRAKELKRGGMCLLTQFALIDNEDEYLEKSNYHHMMTTFTRVLQKLLSENIITQEEFHNITMAFYFRTLDEFQALFQDPNSAVSKSGMKLLSIETMRTPCCSYKAWLKDNLQEKSDGRSVKYSEVFVGTVRPWSNSSIASGLSNKRSDVERHLIVDQVYDGYKALIDANPDDYDLDLTHACIVIQKI